MAKKLRVFVDTNILFSGLLFEGAPRKLLILAAQGKITLVLAEIVLREIRRVLEKKAPGRVKDLEIFLGSVDHESVQLPSKQMVERYLKLIKHKEDAPVLASAVIADTEFVVTGDSHFDEPIVKELIEVIDCKTLLERLTG